MNIFQIIVIDQSLEKKNNNTFCLNIRWLILILSFILALAVILLVVLLIQNNNQNNSSFPSDDDEYRSVNQILKFSKRFFVSVENRLRLRVYIRLKLLNKRIFVKEIKHLKIVFLFTMQSGLWQHFY